MISRPAAYAARFAEAGADCISWHLEAGDRPQQVLAALKAYPRIKKGLAIKPATPLSRIKGMLQNIDFAVVMSVEPGFGGQSFMADMMPKVAELKRLRRSLGLKYLIEVDGGIDAFTAAVAAEAGVDVMVAGTAVFARPNYSAAIRALRRG
jgi:ribulose-phosphate 3-epimerase